MAYLQGLHEAEDALGIDLAVRDQELHIDGLTQNPFEQGLHHLLLVHVHGASTWPSGKPPTSTRKEALVPEEEVPLTVAYPDVDVAQAVTGVVGVSAAPRR